MRVAGAGSGRVPVGKILAAGALLLSGVFAAWFLRAGPSDLTAVEWVVPPAAGNWIAVGGRARFPGGRPVFFVNPGTRAFLRAGFRIAAGENLPVLSADGKTAAWTTSRVTLRGETAYVARTMNLDPEHPVRTAWGETSLREAPLIVFSDDGSRIALLTADRIFLRDRRTGRLLLEARPQRPLWLWGSRGFTTATFVTSDLLRVYSVRPSGADSGEGGLDILELDVERSRLALVGHAGPFERVFPILADSRRERLLLRDASNRVVLLDARNGRTIREFSGGAAASRVADFLSDGNLVLLESGRGQVRLSLLDPSGSPESVVPLGPGERAFFVGEPARGSIDVAVALAAGLRRRDARLLRVDAARGTVNPVADHVFPVTTYSRWTCGDPGRTFAPGSEATRLFYGRNGSLVELDAGTRRARTVLGGRASR